jgi:hypothetical protein
MSKGLRFFGTDLNELVFGNTLTVSSNDAMKDFMFDGVKSTRWISSGENTDGDAVSVEVNFGSAKTLDAFFIYDTNIEDIEVQYYSGAAWATLGSGTAVITKSADLKHVFVKANAPVVATKLKLVGSNTITPNQEKQVTLFHAFLEIGQFEYFPGFTPKNDVFQSSFKTSDGRNFIIERGECFEAEIAFKSHVNQNDITLAEALIERKEPFFIWPCGGDVSIFRFSFFPHRFKDLFKVGILGDNSPSLTNNFYKAGYNNKFKVVEVA